MEITTSVEIGGKKYTGKIGVIKSTRLGFEDHGVLTTSLDVRFDGSGIGVGGYVLDKKGEHGRQGTAYGLDYILRILEVVDTARWENLVGKQVIVLFEGSDTWGGTSAGLANPLTGKAIIFKEHAEAWRAKGGI